MAKIYEKKIDAGTMSKMMAELNVYIDSIKEDIAYEELDKKIDKTEILDRLVQYYANNPMDDTMSYDDWVADFIEGNDLKENRYKPQMKDYLRNIVAIIYSNISDTEDQDEIDNKEEKATPGAKKYKMSEYLNITDDAATYFKSGSQNGNISHHITNVPATLGRSFKNRDILLQRAEEKLLSCNKIYFENDTPGVGRITFAKEFYTKVNSSYNYAAWIRLDGNLKQSILESLTIYPATTDIETRYAQIVAFLKAKKNKILFVIDNTYGYDITEAELKMLEQLRCDVVFVQEPNIPGVEAFNVNTISIDQGIDVFYEYYALDKAHKFIDIIEEYVELANKNVFLIKLLARAAKGYNLAEFLHRVRNDGFTYNDLTGLDNESASILIARNIIKLMKISDITAAQMNVLKYFAVMPNIDIPADIIDALAVDPADIEVLENYAYIDSCERPGYGKTYYMHPLMKQTMHMQFDIKPRDCRALISLIINGSYIKKDDVFATFMAKIKIAEGVLNSFSKGRFDEKGELFNAVGCWFYNCGDYNKALDYCTKAVNIREKIPVDNHPSTATVYDNVARVYNAVGDYDNAILYGEKALYIYEQYGETYINKIASILIILGDAHDNRDTNESAIECYNRALEIVEKKAPTAMLGEIYMKLASVYNEMRDSKKAIDLYQKALKIEEKALGADSLTVALIYNSLAIIRKESGDYDKALDNHNKVLRIREKVLGNEHPLTARTYNHLGRIYLNKGDFQKALDFYVKAYKIFLHIYGDTHPNTRLIRDNLETTYRRSFEKWLNEKLN